MATVQNPGDNRSICRLNRRNAPSSFSIHGEIL
jgi:hypothetical protein